MLLMREDFERMLVDLEYLLDRSYDFKEYKSKRGGWVRRGGRMIVGRFIRKTLCGVSAASCCILRSSFRRIGACFNWRAGVLVVFAHIHECKVAYRDLKPETLVLDNEGNVKIVEFEPA